MPADAPRIKLEGTRALGAAVVTYDRPRTIARRSAGDRRAATGAVLIRPYDEPLIIAGQGTAGLELARAGGADRGAALDAVLVCCGGGGLVAGCAVALTHHVPGIAVLRRRAGRLRRHRPLARRGRAAGQRAPAPARSATRCWPPCPAS